MIKFKCSNCNHKIGAPEKYAGKRVRCPKCKAPTRVPESVGTTPAQKPALIKFRCPGCNQKIGVTSDCAGKRVKCAKCGQALRIPQAPSQAGPAVAKDPTAVLRAGSEEVSAADEFSPDLARMDDLLLTEANAHSFRGPTKQEAVSGDPAESELLALAGRFPEDGSFAETGPRRGVSKKRRLAILIGAGCALGVLLAAVVAWYCLGGSGEPEGPGENRLQEVRQFAEKYIGLLKDGEIERATELLSPGLQSDVNSVDMEALAKQIGKREIVELHCQMTHFEQSPEANQFILLYYLRWKAGGQSVVVSVVEVGEELRIDGIAAQEPQDPFGGGVSIGPSSYEELHGIVLARALEEFGRPLIKFSCGFVLVALVLGLVQVISMWVVFDKAGEPGWAAVIPYYNMWVLAKIADKPGWFGLAACFAGFIPLVGPLVGFVLWVYIAVGVAAAFNRGFFFGMGLAFFPFIFFPILALL